jgi:5-methylcytosine-specific restriction enzyme subunit McrC
VALSALTFTEHENIPVGPSSGTGILSELEADHLCWLGERLPGFCTRGYQNIKLSQHCGLVNLGERVLEILPKVGEHDDPAQSRGVLLRMLRACPDFTLQRQAVAGQAQCTAPLLDLFIRAFFDEVTALMKGGLLRRYLEREEDCLAVRGSILLNRQLTSLANRTDLVACRYDELTADNHWNRLIKAGLRAARPWMHGVALQRSWIELMAGFDEVTDIAEARHLLIGLRYDRQGSRYRPAIEWVERILSLLSPDLRAGAKPAPGLLFDMNRLFESVVEQRMQSWAWNREWRVEAQNFTRYLADIVDEPKRKAFKVLPDLLFTQRGQTVAIVDAKWKHPSLSPRRFVMPDQGDLYQLHGYASVFQCERLALIYPWDDSMAGAQGTTFELPSSSDFHPSVTILCLDVTDDGLPLRLQTDAWAEHYLAPAQI